jgi:hypothetical protein
VNIEPSAASAASRRKSSTRNKKANCVLAFKSIQKSLRENVELEPDHRSSANGHKSYGNERQPRHAEAGRGRASEARLVRACRRRQGSSH